MTKGEGGQKSQKLDDVFYERSQNGNCLEQLSGLVMDGENVRNFVDIQLLGVLGVSEVADIEAR